MERKLNRKAQSIMEYVLIMTVVLVTIISCGFIGNARAALDNYFTKASTAMVH